jgi:signal transduction histidine kinase
MLNSSQSGKRHKDTITVSAYLSLALTGFLIILLVWTTWSHNIFDAYGFAPHGYCFLWNSRLVTLHVVSDSLIGLSYVFISSTLLYFVRTIYHDLPFRWVFVAFGSFIIACGATHFLDIWTLWYATYWLSGTVKLITAVASLSTAVILPPLLPKVRMLIANAKASEERKQKLESAKQELESMNRQLTEMSKLQQNFISVVSHEFRTALTSIQGFSELLETEDFNSKEVKDYASDIHVDATRLDRLITDLLDLERMKTGKMLIHPERLDLNILLTQLIEKTRSTIPPNYPIHLQLDQALPPINGDPDKLTQVILNLLSNVVKYSPTGGAILVSSRLEEEVAHLSVQDHGIGLSPENVARLFIPYNRIDTTENRYIKGTGLGLAIIREICELHHGEVWVESTLGQGSTFHITLPLETSSVRP